MSEREIGANVTAVKDGDRWRIQLDWDDGVRSLSDQSYPTKRAALAELDLWVSEQGGRVESAH